MSLISKVKSHINSTKGIGELIGLGAGFTKGYFDAKGIYIPNNLNLGLVVFPTAFHASLGAYIGLSEAIHEQDDEANPTLKRAGLGLAIGTLELISGYGLGYLAGKLE